MARHPLPPPVLARSVSLYVPLLSISRQLSREGLLNGRRSRLPESIAFLIVLVLLPALFLVRPRYLKSPHHPPFRSRPPARPRSLPRPNPLFRPRRPFVHVIAPTLTEQTLREMWRDRIQEMKKA